MSDRKRAPRKLCPQCGWDAEGKPRAAEKNDPARAKRRAPPPVRHDYDCGNCGFQWTD